MAERLKQDALTFAGLGGSAMMGGFATLSIVPLRPEHQVHLSRLLRAFIAH